MFTEISLANYWFGLIEGGRQDLISRTATNTFFTIKYSANYISFK